MSSYPFFLNIFLGIVILVLFAVYQKKVRDLRRARREVEDILEIRTKARTRELSELAGSLEEKVEERTAELQKRIDELEKFHQLTVGRELKMIELKEKIRDLEKKNLNKKNL
jgi:C4-dicarboxylate-specific signal transduction histidine kinase